MGGGEALNLILKVTAVCLAGKLASTDTSVSDFTSAALSLDEPLRCNEAMKYIVC